MGRIETHCFYFKYNKAATNMQYSEWNTIVTIKKLESLFLYCSFVILDKLLSQFMTQILHIAFYFLINTVDINEMLFMAYS